LGLEIIDNFFNLLFLILSFFNFLFLFFSSSFNENSQKKVYIIICLTIVGILLLLYLYKLIFWLEKLPLQHTTIDFFISTMSSYSLYSYFFVHIESPFFISLQWSNKLPTYVFHHIWRCSWYFYILQKRYPSIKNFFFAK
jgi:hypothetical protein